MSLGCMAMAADPESRPVALGALDAAAISGFPWISVLVTLAAVAVAVWRRLRGRMAGGGSAGDIRILSRTAMGRGRALSLVQVGDRVVLVGESGQGFQRLAEFDAGEAPGHAGIRRVAG